MSAYQLSAVLRAHTADVRGLTSPSNDLILSSSRDASAIIWRKSGKSSASPEWTPEASIGDREGKFVNAVAEMEHVKGNFHLLASASSLIAAYYAPSSSSSASAGPSSFGEPDQVLRGHSSNVCALDVGKDENGAEVVISGSWDKTAIIWKSWKPHLRLTSHSQAVWAVKLLPPTTTSSAYTSGGRYLTASADKSIQLHSAEGKVLRTFVGHGDCVRSLALIEGGEGFWSSGNDGNVIRWSFASDRPVKTYDGHTSFVYAVAALPDGSGCVSSGEDGTVRVWQNDELVQTITHPTISVWTVSVSPNGDIASGASDGIVRVWSKDSSRLASSEERETLERELRSRELNKTQVGDVKMSDLPGMEALARPGKKEGQVIMIKNGSKAEAYQWSSAATTWQQIGEVTDAVGSGRKQVYEGVEYDHVFDVDIAENMPPLKLPYNLHENPYDAAQKFLEKHNLPITYVDQVVKFLESNTAGAITYQSPAYADPYTGASSYRAESTANTGGAAKYSDPYTGGSAYASAPAAGSSSNGSGKKFTPIKTPQYFKTINVNAAKAKINDFNSNMNGGPESEQRKFNKDEETTLNEIYAQLALPEMAQPHNNVSASERYQPSVLLELITRWPEDIRFPLLDLARYLCATSPALPAFSSATGDTVIERLLYASNWAAEWTPIKARETNTLLAARAIANLTSTAQGKKLFRSDRIPDLLTYLASRHPFENFNKNTRTALATIGLNLSVLAAKDELPSGHGPALLQYITNIISNETSDGEVAYRAIVALGNLLSSPALSGSLPVGDVQLVKELASGLANRIGEPRLTKVAQEVEAS